MNSRNLTLLFFFSFFLFVCLYVCLPFLRRVAHSCWFCPPSFRLSLVITHTLTPWISFNLSQSIAKITKTPPPLLVYVINTLLFCASNSHMRGFNQSLKKKYPPVWLFLTYKSRHMSVLTKGTSFYFIVTWYVTKSSFSLPLSRHWVNYEYNRTRNNGKP